MAIVASARDVRDAVLAVLGGESDAAVAERYHLTQQRLRGAIESYRTAGDAAVLKLAEGYEWQQAMLAGPKRRGLAPAGFALLAAGLQEAVTAGVIEAYHFLRKDGGLRLRATPDSERARRDLARILDELAANGAISGWVRGIYEPEVHAFGGPAAMDVAHRLFCADSRAALAAAGRTSRLEPGPREIATLLASTLLRAAGLDWYEQGDVWAKVAELRPAPVLPDAVHFAAGCNAMRRLMTVDPTSAPPGAVGADWPARLAAFDDAGRELARIAHSGSLERGLRGVLAHHLIFAFNRAGLSGAEQSILAYLAKEVIMQPATVSGVEPGDGATTVGRMDAIAASTSVEDEASRLRAELTANLRKRGAVRSDTVADAFGAVPRHLFVPGASLADAYADQQVFTKYADGGEAVSAASQPTIVATMLEQLDVRPGHRVLEAGAGTGYNAALLGHLVGPSGHVTTLDVDADIVDGARQHLAAARVGNVNALLADGALGHSPAAPFDRIIATVGAGVL